MLFLFAPFMLLLLFLFPLVQAQICSLSNVKCAIDGGEAINLWNNCGSTNLLGDSVSIGNSTTNSVKIKDHEYVPLVYREFQSNTSVSTSSSSPFQVDAKFWKFQAGEGDKAPYVTGASGSDVSIAVNGLYHVAWEATSDTQTNNNVYSGWVSINNAASTLDNTNRHGAYASHSNCCWDNWIQMGGSFYRRLEVGDALKLKFGSNNSFQKSFCNAADGMVCRFYIRLVSY